MYKLSAGCIPRVWSAYQEQDQGPEAFDNSDRVYSPGDWKSKARAAVTNAATDARNAGDAACVGEYYRLMATEAGSERPLSSRLLLHYLDGSGTPLGPRPEELWGLPGIHAYQERRLSELVAQHRSLPAGAQVQAALPAESSIDYDQDFLGYRVAYGEDLQTALGHFGLSGSYQGSVVERDGKRLLELDVTWEVKDRYHWWKNNGDHANLRYLQEQGHAKEFDSSTTWASHHELALD